MESHKTSVLQVYNEVIDDVILHTREIFADEGIDESVIQQFKTLWQANLEASKVLDNPASESIEVDEQAKTLVAVLANDVVSIEQNINPERSSQSDVKTEAEQLLQQHSIQIQIVPGLVNEEKNIPVEITLTSKWVTELNQNVFSVYIPESVYDIGKLSTFISGPVLSIINGLHHDEAYSILYQRVNSFVQSEQEQPSSSSCELPQIDESNHVPEQTGTFKKNSPKVKIISAGTDGANDSSSDNEEDDVTTDETDDSNTEEPLNSDDDVSDEDAVEMFTSENIVVCLCDKVSRNKNKWRIFLKDGIMTLLGKDFVFHRASGEVKW